MVMVTFTNGYHNHIYMVMITIDKITINFGFLNHIYMVIITVINMVISRQKSKFKSQLQIDSRIVIRRPNWS